MMESLFRLHQVLSAKDVRLTARCESGNRELLAFVSGCGRLTLCYNENREAKTTVKVIPWFQDTCKRIAALTFDPSCTWLLAAGRDGSLYVVPALALVAPSLVLDTRWSTTDLTLVAEARTTGSAVAIAWWHCQMECQHVGVLAMSCGDIVLVNLGDRTKIGATNLGRDVTAMRICQDPYLDAAFLLVSDSGGQQWRLLLEQRSTGFTWPMDNVANTDPKTDVTNHNTLGVPTARSRLHGLKQLSVEKLASLRQRLAESRTRGGKDSPEPRSKTPEPTRRGSTGSSSDDCKDWSVVRPMAEQLSPDTLLLPQLYRRRSVVTVLYRSKNIVTIHPMKLESGIPLSAHKLATAVSEDLVLTDNFLFVADVARQQITVVSTAFSECRLDGDAEQNPEAVLDHFCFHGDEKILGIFRLSGCDAIGPAAANQLPDVSETKCEQVKSNGDQNKTKEDRKKSEEDKSRGKTERKKTDEEKKRPKEERKKQEVKEEDKKKRDRRSRSRGKEDTRVKEFSLPSCVADMQIERRPVDTCVVVTTAGVYKLLLRRDSVETFMDLVLERGELEAAERLAVTLRLDLQHLLELAGDLQLSRCKFQQATALYKLSRCRHLKSVLKLAAVGNSAALLRYVEDLLATVGSTELSASERIHLANLAVMAHADLVLRADAKQSATDRFIHFLSANQCYDQVLAVNVAGQTRLWGVLCYLSSQRGLHPELLDVLTRVLGALAEAGLEAGAPALDGDLWSAASDPALLPHMLAKPRQCSQHLANVRLCLSHLPTATLANLADMLDPTSVNFRPTLRKMFKTDVNHEEPMSVNVGSEVVLVFLLVLARLVPPPPFIPSLLAPPPPHTPPRKEAAQAVTRSGTVGAGFAHAALVRNAGLYTWGAVQHGCLGTGPTVSRFQPAQPVQALTSARVEVLAVTCGRLHTLALTNNGVYSWGSNQFGQLGIGRTCQTSWPRAVTALSDEEVVQVSAGQYHSLALTADGRVFSWGWAVHGQLGTGSIEDVFTPSLVPLLPPITAISAGHAHSLALARDGAVFAFGSAMFGQLGTGSLVKQTRPVHVAGLPEPVVHLATGYFHNLALTSSGQLYTWGLSPQSLRLQVQAHKKQRLLHKHAANHSEPETIAANHSEPETITANQSEGDTTAANGSEEETIMANQRAGDGNEVTESLVKIIISNVKSAVREEIVSEAEQQRDKTAEKVLDQSQSKTEYAGQSEDRKVELPAYLVEDSSHGHIVPSLVDTSLVAGNILQVATGGHHSALVTDEGGLYTWGRNLEGQLGCGGRREVTKPTRLATLDSFGDKTTVKEVACGSEFTVALTSSRSARVLAWGCNASAQLGKAPSEDGKALDGKIVMIKTVKRVIKLPHGSNNAVDLPREVPGLGNVSITFRSHTHSAFTNILRAVKRDVESLHYLLVRLHGRYNSASLSTALLDLGHFQLAGSLASVGNHPLEALRYHMHAVERSNQPSPVVQDPAVSTHILAAETQDNSEISAEDDSKLPENLQQQLNTHSEEVISKENPLINVELQDTSEVHTDNQESIQEVSDISSVINENIIQLPDFDDKSSHLDALESVKDAFNMQDLSEPTHEDSVVEEKPFVGFHFPGGLLNAVKHLALDVHASPELKSSIDGEISSEVASKNENAIKCDVLDRPELPSIEEDVKTSKGSSSSTIEFSNNSLSDNPIKHLAAHDILTDREQGSDISTVSQPRCEDGVVYDEEKEDKDEASEGKEMHAFSVQGGTEEMSEGGSTVTTPSDSLSAPPITPSDDNHCQPETKISEDESMNNEVETKLDEIMPEVNEVETKLDEIRPDVNEVETKIDEIMPDVNEVEAKLDEIMPDVNEVETKLDEIMPDVNEIETKLDEIMPDVNEVETKLDEIMPKVNQNESNVDEKIVNEIKSSLNEIQPESHEIEPKIKEVNDNEPKINKIEPEIQVVTKIEPKINEVTENKPDVNENEPKINKVNDVGTKSDEREPKINDITENKPEVNENEPKINKVNDVETKSDEREPGINASVSASDLDEMDRVVEEKRLVRMAMQAAEVVDYFLLQAEGPLLTDMLTEALGFWWRLQLPVEPLEAVLRQRAPVFYSLGTLIFKESEAEGPGSMLSRFSSDFCLQVCSHLTTHIDLDKPHQELLDLLRTTQHGPNGCSLLPVPSLGPSH